MAAVQRQRQNPIGSGFGHDTTSSEVMAGVDLSGRVAVVTGGYSGLGLETVRQLMAAGARVVIPARRVDVAEKAVTDLRGSVQVISADLASIQSVVGCADRIAAEHDRIDLFFATAGVMASPLRRVGEGWESQFAINHLGHYAFIVRLWAALVRGSARVIVYSSAGHHNSPIRWDDLQFDRGYDKWAAYGQAKTANVLFAVRADQLGASAGVRTFALHPGAILTPLQRHLPTAEMVELGWIDGEGHVLDPTFKTVSQGAATGLWAATSRRLDGAGGLYLEDCDVATIAEGDMPDHNGSGVKRYAIDQDQARSLWELSARLTGVDIADPAGIA